MDYLKVRVSINVINTLYAKYKIYRNKICTLTRLRKQLYYSKFFNDNLTEMKKKKKKVGRKTHYSCWGP